MTELTIVRHGETEWNAQGRMQGHLDSPLTENGVRQARATARALAEQHFDAVYASPLGRARQTAELITEGTNRTIRFDDGLRERNLGVMQGLSVAELKISIPEDFEKIHTDPDYVIPEGESSRQRFDRGNNCLQGIAGRHPDGSILVVTHGGIVDSIIRKIFDIPLADRRYFSLYNCAINVIGIEAAGWSLLTWGGIAHLENSNVLDDD